MELHYSVMKKEVIDNLNITEGNIYVDATLGYAGHSSEILKKNKKGFLFAFDADAEAIKSSNERLSKIGNNFELIHSNFKNLKEELSKRNISHVDGIIFDLGLSSPQIDNATRGFSYMHDGDLDMRMNKEDSFDAKELVNNYSYDDLVDIFFKYGEEKTSKAIASKIVAKRKEKEIKTTKELTEIIRESVGDKYFYKFHPERVIFQAIRIEVNDELNVLRSVLPDAINLLNKNGRICVITFHSLEDRIVKTTFKKYSEVEEPFKGLPIIPKDKEPLIKLINKKPILPSKEELEINSRSASAKLRVIERI